MKPRPNLRSYHVVWISRAHAHAPCLQNCNRFSAPRTGQSAPRSIQFSILGPAIAFLALALASACVNAQQNYPGSPYGGYGAPALQPSPQNSYAQPQYQQPQSAPQQPYAYAQQPDAQQPYVSSEQPYPQATPYPDDLTQPTAPAQAPLSAEQLEQLLAPVALYPDALLAQILTASTYPAQVAVADQWVSQMRAQGYGSPDQIAAGADEQADWDPSVKALTATPDVLDMMNHNLDWTTALGDAYYNQPQDVMQTVQVLRQRAEQAGNLQTTPEEDVTSDQGYIALAPPNPQIVYVPTYDPWDVYGAPVAPYPGFALVGPLGSFFGGAPIQYGLCFALGAFERMPFGWIGWGFDWLGHAVLFNHSSYFTHSTTVADWGLPRGGPRAYGRGGFDRTRSAQYRAYDSRGAAQQTYNQRGYGYDQRSNAYANRGSQPPAYAYMRPALPAQNYNHAAPQNDTRTMPQQSYGYRPQTYPNRPQTYASRPQQSFSNPQYGYSRPSTYGHAGYGYGAQTYAARPNYAYSNPAQSNRAPQYNSRAYSSRSYSSYANQMARNDSRNERSSFFGGQHNSYSAPKQPSYRAPKSYGGGHMSAPKMPGMGRSGGGSGGGRRR